MFETILVAMEMARLEAQYREQREKKWREKFDAASPEVRKIMIEVKRKMEKEATTERRHREQVQAQKEIADAIRYAARPGRHFFDF